MLAIALLSAGIGAARPGLDAGRRLVGRLAVESVPRRAQTRTRGRHRDRFRLRRSPPSSPPTPLPRPSSPPARWWWGPSGHRAAEVSVFFETFLLFRAPLTVSYSLIARVLPPFTAMVERGETAILRRWALRIAGAGAVLAAAAYAIGLAVGADRGPVDARRGVPPDRPNWRPWRPPVPPSPPLRCSSSNS